ncbi:hypothetical protein, partial [Saccharicrinis fermentans]|uniref:hypothetical protein n=1 Tax=Saccharicrinis fermentans TaxID=982 RepID=UPI001F46114E
GFHLKRVILFLTVLVWMVGCSTHKELNQLRRQYVKNDDICDCNGFGMASCWRCYSWRVGKVVELLSCVSHLIDNFYFCTQLSE